MTDEQIALARRAVACRDWRWMHGMSNDHGEVIDCVDVVSRIAYCGDFNAYPNALPDLSDSATIGCLLALVRDAWDDQLLGVAFDFDGGEWCVRLWNGSSLGKGFGKTEAEALIAALEAAP